MPRQFCHFKIVGGSKVCLWCVPEGFGSGVCHPRELCWAKQVHLRFPSSLKTYPEHRDRGPLVSKDGIPWLFQFCTGVMTCSEDCSPQPWLSLPWIQCHLFHGLSLTMGCWCGGFFCSFSCVISVFFTLKHSKHTAIENHIYKYNQPANCCALRKPISPCPLFPLSIGKGTVCTAWSSPSGQLILLTFSWSFLISYHFSNQLRILHEENGAGYLHRQQGYPECSSEY